jgi:pilus assembly protein CpaF
MEGDIVTLSEVFRYESTGIDDEGKMIGRLVPTGIRSMFDKKLEVAGVKLGAQIFSTPPQQGDTQSTRRRGR